MFKPDQGILSYLKMQGRSIDLPIDVLRQFQEFEKVLDAGLKSYEGKDPAVTYAMQSFTKVEMFGMILISSDEFPAVRRAHDELMRLFKKDGAFGDGISLMSWLLFNFPATAGGEPLAREVLRRTPTLNDDIGPFVEEALGSRLGLYEVLKNSRNECRLKELITANLVTLNQSLGGMERGTVALCRVISIGAGKWIFGDAPGFPASKKSTLEGMIRDKMSLYFWDKSAVTSYETMMRLAGPYWFSIMAVDYDGDILNADHYLYYYGRKHSGQQQ